MISYIGMQTQEVDIKPNIKVFMRSDSEMLDEVMVVAYGTAKKSAFTGSASVIKSETLEKRQVSNLSNALSATWLPRRGWTRSARGFPRKAAERPWTSRSAGTKKSRLLSATVRRYGYNGIWIMMALGCGRVFFVMRARPLQHGIDSRKNCECSFCLTP